MLQKSSFLNLAKFFGYCFFVSLPFNVGVLVFSKDVYSSAFFNPFLSQFVYVGDVFLLLSVLFLACGYALGQIGEFRVGEKKIFVLLMFFLLAMILSLFFSVDFVNSLFYLLRFLELLVVYFLIVNDVLGLEKVLLCFVAGVSVSAFIGILQFFSQGSFGLKFLGEPLVNAATTGVAKFQAFGHNIMRSYGTFPHPNLFGAYLVLAILFCVGLVRKAIFNKKVLFVAIALCFVALVLTFSRSAFLALFLGLGSYLLFSRTRFSRKTIVVAAVLIGALLLIRPSFDQGLEERLLFLKISWRMFFHNVFGVGIGNFTDVMQNYTNLELLPWNFQPVHNIFLLILNEAGLIGFTVILALFGYLFWLIFNKVANLEDKSFLFSILTAICVFGIFDHYLISLHQGQVLLFLMIGIFGCFDENGYFSLK